ncbi:hypothetical protein [uncultured Cohaesibacter sp.]|uniref:hypothetical protein n=1 Tax=uncultured Cohaesibacter sp. TaxID=1002546 RepID=UPI002AAB1C36|nr:hypothetical protein [uncultured Cohaesibacter sp.]
MENYDYLGDFYKAIQSKMPVPAFLSMLEELEKQICIRDHYIHRRSGDRANGKSPSFKVLESEIVPVKRYLNYAKPFDSQIQFSVSSEAPDCRIFMQSHQPVGIEVTSIRNAAQREIAEALNQSGYYHGISTIRDAEPKQSKHLFHNRRNRSYTTDEVVENYLHDIENVCVRKANSSCADILLIACREGMECLSAQNWQSRISTLAIPTSKLKIGQVFLVGRGEHGDLCFQLK